MSLVPTHISDDELIDFATDELEQDRIPEVLEHLAACDECALRSTTVMRQSAIWDNWQANLARVEAPAAFWRKRVAGALADLRRSARDTSAAAAAVLDRLREAPGTVAGAALEIAWNATGTAGEILARAADSVGLAGGRMDLSYSTADSVRGGSGEGGSDAGERSAAFLVLPAWRDGVDVKLHSGGRLELNFQAGATPPIVLLIPASGAPPTIAAGLSATDKHTAVLEIGDLPPDRFLLLILPGET